MEEQVIIVNEDDEVCGVGEKVKTHLDGELHRAFSIFVFNSRGELLIQKRASLKYHSKGLWSNTCCGHPRPGESTEEASHRRLMEEMGFDCVLKEIFEFTYKTQLSDNLWEHEYDHLLIGKFDGDAIPCTEEVDAWKWVDVVELGQDIRENPDNYTYWFKISLDMLLDQFDNLESLPVPTGFVGCRDGIHVVR